MRSNDLDLSVVGQRRPRLDGPVKVSGRAQFSDDVRLPGMLHARVLRSRHAHARIVRLDVSQAEALPGVKAVITAADAKGIYATQNEPAICGDVTRYIGEELAAVAAIDEATAARALELIEVEYEVLPAVTTIREALKPDAPQVDPGIAGNIVTDNVDAYGEVDEAFAGADYVFEDQFVTRPTHNLFAEYHVCVADFSQPDKLEVWTPTQTSYLFQHSFARAFKLSLNQVRIVHLHTGGAFSGRGSVRPHHYIAALLSRKAQRPVKLFSSGDEEFLICRTLGDNQYTLRTAVDKDGTVRAIDVDATLDGGGQGHALGYFGWMVGLCMSWIMDLDAIRFRRRVVLTNQRPNYLGHGGMMIGTNAGLMQQLQRIAAFLGRDPIDFLLQNAVQTGHKGLTGEHFASCGLTECLETVRDASGWNDKYGKLEPYHGIGVSMGAMAAGARGAFKHDTSAAMVKVGEDGLVTVYTGIPDMGQGTHTTMAIIAAEVLGIQATDIRVIAGDTDITPVDVGAFAQRGTIMTGNAVKNAAQEARDQLAKNAADWLEVEVDSLEFDGGHIRVKGQPDKSLPFSKVAFGSLHSKEGRFVMGRGFYTTPIEYGTAAWSFGAQVAEVKVDPETGEVNVLKVWVAHDCGRAINPLAIEGQIDGQVFSAMSQVLYEECVTDEGQYLNPSRLEYKMPRTYEMPEVEYFLIESNDPYGPFGAKEVGEGPIVVAGG
ncbi:MAG: xanthine dehydrogenase family protein molybdopterin-binding subunit, partial [Gammaproteobacteria bacterium]|nr:xanthine dehydrogenase family protein molybdopterin-binding subunit [Gammaproteobacteria bacterium]